MKILDLLAEALKPSQYRSLVKSWDKSRYADIFSKYPHDRTELLIRKYFLKPVHFSMFLLYHTSNI